MAKGTGGLLQRMNDIAAHGDAVAKWARTTPEQEWREVVRTQLAPIPPFGAPPYVYVKKGLGMHPDRFQREVETLYKLRTKAPEFADFLFRDFPPDLTADDITFVGPDANMALTALAQRAVDVQIAMEEALDFPNNLTAEQRASLVDVSDDSAARAGAKTETANALDESGIAITIVNANAKSDKIWVEIPSVPPRVAMFDPSTGRPVLDASDEPVFVEAGEPFKNLQSELGLVHMKIFEGAKDKWITLFNNEGPTMRTRRNALVSAPLDLEVEHKQAKVLGFFEPESLGPNFELADSSNYGLQLAYAFMKPILMDLLDTLEGAEYVINTFSDYYHGELDSQIKRYILSIASNPDKFDEEPLPSYFLPWQELEFTHVVRKFVDLGVPLKDLKYSRHASGRGELSIVSTADKGITDKNSVRYAGIGYSFPLLKKQDSLNYGPEYKTELRYRYPLKDADIAKDGLLMAAGFFGGAAGSALTSPLDFLIIPLEAIGKSDNKLELVWLVLSLYWVKKTKFIKTYLEKTGLDKRIEKYIKEEGLGHIFKLDTITKVIEEFLDYIIGIIIKAAGSMLGELTFEKIEQVFEDVSNDLSKKIGYSE